MGTQSEALEWQIGVWDRISHLYLQEVDRRFVPVIRHTVQRADPQPGQSILDLGTGTGAVAIVLSPIVGASGSITALDLSPDMITIADERISALGITNVRLVEGRAEEIPAEDAEFDSIVASLSLMYAIDRAAAARECARVLRPGGRLVATVWGGPDEADIVRFQTTAGSFAPPPPAPGVGPGALADAAPFLTQLADAGIDARVEAETTEFEFPTFEQAWDVLAGVTTAQLSPERREEAQAAVRARMWPHEGPRTFTNKTQFIVGTRAG